jgi:hypothetical protein
MAVLQITSLLNTFEERCAKAQLTEKAQQEADAAEERAQREAREKERMFKRMQEELAMKTGW